MSKLIAIGHGILTDAIEAAVLTAQGPCWKRKMVTVKVNEDDTIEFIPFDFDRDIPEDERIKWLHDMLLDECPVRPFSPFAHQRENPYPHGLGKGRPALISTIERWANVPSEQATMLFEWLVEEGKVVSLGIFHAKVGGGPFEMWAAVAENPVGSSR